MIDHAPRMPSSDPVQPGPTAMTSSFEQRLLQACQQFIAARDRFVTEVLEVAQEASVEAVERAFALVQAARTPCTSAPHDDASATTAGIPAPATSEKAGSTSETERVLACVRQAPGSHIGQLSESLAMPASKVRRHLQRLATGDAIRIAGGRGPWHGESRQTFFPRESSSVDTESSASALEATA